VLRSEAGTMGDNGGTLEIERVDVQLRVEDLVEREVVCGAVRARQASPSSSSSFVTLEPRVE